MSRRFLPRAVTTAVGTYVLATAEIVYDQTLGTIRLGDSVTPGGNLLPALGTTLTSLNPKGPTDRTADFTAASTAAGNAGAFVLASGSYPLSAAPSFTESGIFGVGGQFSGAGIPGIADDSIRQNSSFYMGRQTAAAGNRYTKSVHMVLLPGGSHTVSFEKDAFATSLVHYDNSTYSSDGDGGTAGVLTSARDGVAIAGHAAVPAGLGLTRTRIWGGNNQVSMGAAGQEGTADGAIAGYEIRIDNYGSDSPWFETALTKVVAPLFAGGTRRVTAFSFAGLGGAAGSGCGAYYGYTVDTAAVSLYGFSVMHVDDGNNPQNAIWGITPTGAEEFKAQTTPPAPAAGRVRQWFDGTNMKLIYPDGTIKTVQAT